MNHKELIQLYFNRDEQASAETYRQFGGYCYTIANNILGNAQDAEECVNDVMIRLWERIPPNRPDNFYGYITVLTRRIACTRFNAARAKKRGGEKRPLHSMNWMNVQAMIPLTNRSTEWHSASR